MYTTAIQLTDGSLDDGSEVEPPQVWIYRADDNPLSSDQARELAEALLDCAKEIDAWASLRNSVQLIESEP